MYNISIYIGGGQSDTVTFQEPPKLEDGKREKNSVLFVINNNVEMDN